MLSLDLVAQSECIRIYEYLCVPTFLQKTLIIVYHYNIFKYPEEFHLVNLHVSLYLSRTELLEYVPVLLILKGL